MNNVHIEKQKFAKWIIFLIFPIVLLFGLGVYQQIIMGIPFGDKPSPNFMLILMFMLSLLLLILFWKASLQIKIDTTTIDIVFSPFLKRSILWKDVKTATVVNYGFVGGWGVRFSKQYGKIYSTKGKHGVFLELNNGEKLMISTQNKIALDQYLETNQLPK
ncbi:MAG: hypothetical protein ACJAUV_000683 [Flavobacteriales bacterium]|jgi:hypothetical protein